MPRRRYCSKCAKRLPEAADRCVVCGASPRADDGSNSRGRTAVLVGFLALLTVLAVGFSDRYVPAVADWYSRLVIQYMPEPVLHYVPASDDRRAFYLCARSVARQIEEDASIVTFAAASGLESAVPVGDDRFQVHSFVDEALENGTTLRREFTCTLRLDDGGWHLEDVQLEPLRNAVAAL